MDWTARTSRIHLASGFHLVTADGRNLLSAPGDRFFELLVDGALGAAMQRVVRGEAPPAAALSTVADPEAAASLLELLSELGALVPVDSEAIHAAPPPPGGDVHVLGDTPLARAVADLLESAGLEVRAAPALEPPLEPARAVVACAGWLADRCFRRLDGWCRKHDVAFCPVHAEGQRFHVGPLALPGGGPCYADARARRLSASGAPAELEALWVALESEPQPPVLWPGREALALVAGAVATPLVCWLRAAPVPAAGCQLVVDPSELALTRHHVIPLPVVADR